MQLNVLEDSRRKDTKSMNCQISVSRELYKEIEKKITGSRFNSVEHYFAHVVREMLAADEGEDTLLTREQEDKITERLRALGYLD